MKNNGKKMQQNVSSGKHQSSAIVIIFLFSIFKSTYIVFKTEYDFMKVIRGNMLQQKTLLFLIFFYVWNL